MYDLNGKVAIISGGASCMGRAAAHVEIGFGHGRSFGGLGDVRFSESPRVLGEVLEQRGRHPLPPSTRASFASLIPVSVRHERRSSGVITDRRSASDVERERMCRGWRGTAPSPPFSGRVRDRGVVFHQRSPRDPDLRKALRRQLIRAPRATPWRP